MYTSKVNIPNFRLLLTAFQGCVTLYGLSNIPHLTNRGKVTLFILDSNEVIKFDLVSNGQDQNHIAYKYLWSM